MNPVPGPPTEPKPGLVLPDAGDETWAKVSFDLTTWHAMPRILGGIVDPLARTVVWNALRLAVADAEVDPAVALEIALATLVDEPNDAVLSSVLPWTVRSLIGTYLPSEARAGAYERISATALRGALGAPPGSGRQLAAVRGLAGSWADVDRLGQWLGGNALPDGLVLDADLRWVLLHRLAVLGALTPGEIDDEAARDNTAQGTVSAAKCRASLPEPLAKARAWETLMTDAHCSNYELYALAEGFWQPEHDALTAPFVARYFDEIRGTAAIRSGWVLARLAHLCYPWATVHPTTVEHTERLLACPDLDEAIRRSVRDDLRRALASRQKFSPRA